MNTIKKYVMWSVLLSALISLSGCGNNSSEVATASDFSMTLDVEESTVSGDWKMLSSASGDNPLGASVLAQGNYGNFVVEGDELTYLKTTETNETDTGILAISNNGGSVQVTVTVHSLYWKQTSEADGHTSALKSDGTIWSWGLNNDGQLGNGTTDDSTVPVQESSESTDWVSTSSGGNHTAGLKSDGTIWSWGLNGYGQLGDGTTDSSSIPVQEETESTDWSSVRAGSGYSVAKKLNGETYRWGRRNTRPIANDQSVVTDENVAKAITLTGSDADGDPLTYIVVSDPSNGTLTGTAPNLTYTPDTDYTGSDSFTFKVNDGSVDSKVATVSITINPVVVNTPPVANDQSVVTDENVATAITLTGSDADNDPLTYTVLSDPSNGILTGTAPNLIYTPNTDYAGPDSFTFIVNDGSVDSAPATVSITVNNVVVNTPPVANDQSIVTDENVATAITLTGSDADGDPLSYMVMSDPSNGILTGTAPNLTYTPNTDYDGPDSFTFIVNDGSVDSAPATVSITVNDVVVNTPPVANDQSVVTDENVAVDITLTGSDADGDPLTYSVVSNPSNGTLTGTAPDLTYTPNTDYDGLDSFTFKVNDGTEDSAVATVGITVNSVYASDDALAQIGFEADSPDVVDSTITIAQLNVILPVLTDVIAANETAYQDYIDANPDLFSSPATQVEVQAMIDAVNAEQSAIAASDAVLAQIGDEADVPDTVNSVVTVAQLGDIFPALTNIDAGKETAYQDYIDANPDLFSSPATQAEVQSMIDVVNGDKLPLNITIDNAALQKAIGSIMDTVPYPIDIQGVIDADGLNVTIPYTVVNAPVTLPAYSTSVTLDASVTEDDEAGIVATFSWVEQADLPVGSGTFSAKISIDDSSAGIPDDTYNAKKLDIQDDIGGVEAATFSYVTDPVGNEGVLTLTIYPGIPDRMFGTADNTGNANNHMFLYLPVTNPTTGKTWLNNNLGANYANINSPVFDIEQQATASDDYNAYGSLFQWGRKADGHELINRIDGYTATGVNGATSINSDNPTDALFITETVSPYDWRITQDDTLWASEVSENNVCPKGYRVPTGAELDVERQSWESNNIVGALNSTLALSLPGTRNGANGGVFDLGGRGFYWGATGYGLGSKYLYFDGSIASINSIARVHGFPVRCIKAPTPEEIASDAILAQIGLEADNPDVIDSNVTVAQLGAILPALTDVTAANEEAYQDYIDANPDLFSSPATQVEVQAMIDAVKMIINDNFDAETVGTLPAGWIIQYNGTGDANQKVVDTVYKSPNHSFQLEGRAGWAANIYKVPSAVPNNVTVESNIYINNIVPDYAGFIVLRNKDTDTWGTTIGGLKYEDGKFIAYAQDFRSGYEITNFTPQQWYHVKIVYDTLARTFQVYIDGTLAIGTDGVSSYTTFPMHQTVGVASDTVLMLAAGNGGTVKVFYDDVKMYEH